VLGRITASGKHTLSPDTGADGSETAAAVLLYAVDATLADAVGIVVVRGPAIASRAALAYALREDAYPRVTMLTDRLPAGGRKLITLLNFGLMTGVGLFFSMAAVNATIRAFNSGSSSEILLWPRWMFWAPGATSLILFTIYVALRLARVVLTPAREV